MSGLQMRLAAKVLRLDPKTHIATVQLPAVSAGRAFKVDYAAPGEGLAPVVEWPSNGGSVGAVVAVKPRGGGAEVDIKVTGEGLWRRLGSGRSRIDVGVTFASAGLNPSGGRVTKIEID